MKTAITICSGGELAGMGIMAAGYQLIGGVEIEPAIADVAEWNTGHRPLVSDVRNVCWSRFDRPNLLWASPSCKTASIANQNGGETSLDYEVAESICRAIKTLGPETFILENVRGYATYRAFGLIVHTLEELGYWHNGGEIINSADLGVPQTRVRLILRAQREDQNPSGQPNLMGGGTLGPVKYRVPWIGWYEAIEDLLPRLPESEFVPWQLERMPDYFSGHTMGTGHANTSRPPTELTAERPSTSVIAHMGNRPLHMSWAFLQMTEASSSSPETGGTGIKEIGTPSGTVATNSDRMARAFIVSGTEMRNMAICKSDEPVFSQTSSAAEKGAPRAFLVSGQGNRLGFGGSVTIASDENPSMTVQAVTGTRNPLKAWLKENGRTVRMTPRALARFQSVPDSYKLPDDKQRFKSVIDGKSQNLACTIIGNGVPCLMAQRLVELTHN